MASGTKDKVRYVRVNFVLMPRASTVLRNMFRAKYRDAFDTPWRDTEHQGKIFTENVGKTIYTTASRRQKQLLLSGRVDLWDLQLLTNILLKLKFGRKDDENPIGNPNENLIEQLAKIDARVRRSANHSLSRDEFETTWETVKEILIRLGDPVSELETLETTTNMEDVRHEYTALPIDPYIQEKAEDFHRSANECHKKGKFDDAISYYDRCVKLYGSNRKLAAVYSHRSAAYLNLEDEVFILSDDTNKKLARDDAKNALELWPTWYEAHYRLGRAYEQLWKDKMAAKHYEIALVLNPTSAKIGAKLRRLLARSRHGENWEENDGFDLETSPEYLENQKNTFQMLGGPYWTVWTAMCHLGGHGVEKNENEAAILMSRAAETGNSYAMLLLANMYVRGIGVDKDAEKYVEILTKVAEKQFHASGSRNEYSVIAELNLGVAYTEGIGVRKDLERAIEWYKMAAAHGSAAAAHNLGCNYAGGSGVEKDEGIAVEYWKMAARGKLARAMRRLSDYYLYTDLDPDQALEWHEIARGYEQDEAHAHYDNKLMILKELCRMSDIGEWEKRIGLSSEGYSIRERKYRYIRYMIPSFPRDYCEKNESLTVMDLPEDAKKTFNAYEYPFACVFDCDANERVRQAVIRFGRAISCLKEINKAGKKFIFIYELARCLETELIVTHWDPPDRQMAARIVDELWNDVLSLAWVKRLLDKDARICYAYFHPRDEAVHRDCVAKYPDVAYFRRMLVGAMADHEAGLREADAALGVFRNDWDLMFAKARHLACLGTSPMRLVKALREFVSAAPPDHWFVPGAYYAMALMYVRMKPELNGETEPEARKKVTRYFCRGLSAEANQLPCLVKYQNGRMERLFELTLEMKLGRRKTARDKNKLVEPSRVELIKMHRKRVRDKGADGYAGKCVRFEQEKNVFLLLTLKFVDLNEIDAIRDDVYRGKAICVRIVEDFFVLGGINLLVEDRNGDVRSVRIADATAQDGKRLEYGARLIIREPDVRMGMDARQIIWVWRMESVIFVSGEDLKICRFCREKIDKGMCAKCRKAYYCSKQCQVRDWKVMKHKWICF